MKRIQKIQKEMKKQQSAKAQTIEPAKAELIIKEYGTALDTDPKYTLIVDPENKYNMPDIQKTFISYYCQYKSIPMAAELCNIDMDTAKSFFAAYASQQEIRRINLAMYHRQFHTKMLNLDEIGGYLSALIQDEVALADRISSNDKIRVAQILIGLNEKKQAAVIDPNYITVTDIETEIKNLSVDSIKALIEQNDNNEAKQDAVNKLRHANKFTTEELAYLSTLPLSDLLQFLDDINKGGGQ